MKNGALTLGRNPLITFKNPCKTKQITMTKANEKDEAKVILDATLQLMHSLSCPASNLRFARRLMSSTIGVRKDRIGSHFNPSIMKSIHRNYQRRLLAQNMEESQHSKLGNDIMNKAKVEEHVNQAMQTAELLFQKLERNINNDESTGKWMVLFSKLAGTCSKEENLQRQRKNLKLLQTQRLDQDEGGSSNSEHDFNGIEQSLHQDQSISVHEQMAKNAEELRLKAKRKATIQQTNTLLRECIFALQGIEGESIRFLLHNEEKSDPNLYEGIRLRPGSCVQISNNPIMVMDAIRICGECGWLYLRIKAYINSQHAENDISTTSEGRGVINRALCAGLTKELGEYHRLLAIFESQLRNPNEKDKHVNNTSLTLRRLLVWLREPTLRLQMLATVTDGVRALRGGQLADALHLHATTHGDPVVQNLLLSLISTTTVPLYRMLRNWIIEGSLPQDSHKEFFIVEINKTANRYQKRGKLGTHSFHWENELNSDKDDVWEGKYDMNLDMLPRFIGEELAYEAFVVGKGINFIRICLDDPSWRLTFDKGNGSFQHGNNGMNFHDESEKNLQISFQYGNENILYQTVQFASRQIHSHILSSLVGPKHNLMDHLLGLKRILLLGQGDFVAALLDGIHFELDKPASRVYIHNLNAIFDNALRSTNARFLPAYVLEKVQVKLMKASNAVLFSDKDVHDDTTVLEEDRGWDIFSLDYNVQAPLSAIVHSNAIQQYRKIFHLLWKLKQIEWALNKNWKRANILNHALWQYQEQYNSAKSARTSRQSAMALLNMAATTRRSMQHFVSNLQSYLLFEVIEGGWKKLIQSMEGSQSLDKLIEAHNTYLHEICSKALLAGNNSGTIPSQLSHVFEKCSEFCSWQDSALQVAADILDEARIRRSEAERRTAAGLWGYDMKQGEVDDDIKFFTALSNPENSKTVRQISEDFKKVLTDLLDMLHNEMSTTSDQTMESPISAERLCPSGMNTVDTLAIKYRAKRQQQQNNMDETNAYERDDSLRFLAFQLDFNEYYSNPVPKE